MKRIVNNALFLLLFFCSLKSDDELVIPLATQSPFTPIYVGAFDNTASPYPGEYAEELERVLLFDLKYGGRVTISPRHEKREEWLAHPDHQKAFNVEQWKEAGVSFVVKPTLTSSALSIKLFNVATSELKHFSNIALSGNIIDDRRRLHGITDVMHKLMTGHEGIASTHILYAFQQQGTSGKWLSEIWQCDYDGANARQVTKEESYCITPTFLPAKRGISTLFAYVNYKLGQPKIYISSLGKSQGLPCVELRGNQLLPTFSRAGNKIAFVSDAAGRADLFVQAFDAEAGCVGKPIQAYSFPRSVQASPSFSPDGTQIAFVSDKDGTPRIYVIDTPRGERGNTLPKARCLTTLHRDNTCPSWSPDGKKLAYSARVDGVRQIMLYDCDTKRETQLTTGPGHKENPCWARNSLHLVYNNVTPSGSELFLLNVHQRESVKITTGPGRKHYPAWEP